MANVLETSMNYLQTQDPEVAACIENEFQRQKQNIELIASENIASPAVIAAMGSVLTNKYAEGYPGKRYYGGCDYVDVLETIAIERAKKLFGAAYANVQPHSGAQANLEVYAALLQPGDTLMGMDLASGGHLTHGARVNLSGKYYNSISYGVNPETGCIDYDQVEDMVRRYCPKLLVAGASAYPRAIDFKAFAEIAHKNGALLMVDMAHIGGLVAAGVHPSPVPYADVVTSTTHKTLRGPRGAIILCKDELKKKINSAVFPGTQGGPLMHIIAGKAVCFKEAMSEEFKAYQRQVVKNAAVLADTLSENGIRLVSGGTDNHLMLADTMSLGRTGNEVQELLDAAHITANKNSIPFDTQSVKLTSGMRFGTPAVTTRGMGEDEMRDIGKMIVRIINDGDKAIDDVKQQVLSLCERFPLYPEIEM